MRCPNCGNENPDDYMFCDECGARLGNSELAADTSGAESGPDMQASNHTYGGSGAVGSDVVQSMGNNTGMGTDSNAGMAANNEQDTAMAPTGSGSDVGVGTDTEAEAETPPPVTEDTMPAGMPAYDYSPMGDNGQANVWQAEATPAPMPGVEVIEPMAHDHDHDHDHDMQESASSSSMPMPDHAANVTSEAAGEATHSSMDTDTNISTYAPISTDTMDTADRVATGDAGANAGEEVESGMAPAVPVGSSPSATSADTSDTSSMGAEAGMGTSGGNQWATEALRLLGSAQLALGSGDWGGFGQAMGNLKSALESATQGASSAAVPTSMPTSMPTPEPASSSPAPSMDTSDTGVSAPTAHAGANLATDSYVGSSLTDYANTGAADTSSASTNMNTGGMGEMGDTGTAQAQSMENMEPYTSAPAPAPISMLTPMAPITPMPMAPEAQPQAQAQSQAQSQAQGDMARLVIISTGAEMSLPDQEEITVGREDPSSGIFPDVDLTPYGGEDGGVSRRHARVLHIGDDYFVEDLQSTNYTKLDGQRLPAHVRERLEDGARLDFGRVAAIFRRS